MVCENIRESLPCLSGSFSVFIRGSSSHVSQHSRVIVVCVCLYYPLS